MKRILFFSLMAMPLILVAFHCQKDTVPTPDCIQSKIPLFSSQACDSGATVKEYIFQSQHVFVFDFGPCGADMALPVLNSSCDTLGYLGGFIGNTVINNEEFSHSVFLSTIWHN